MGAIGVNESDRQKDAAGFLGGKAGYRQPLKTWHAMACKADWKTPADVKADYRNASIIANNRVVFNIKGNDYRLIAAINYDVGVIWIKFIGTHAEYDRIDAATVG